MSVKIIAEIAQGYEGNQRQTLELTKAALSTNCDVIKFQCLYADETAVPSYVHYDFFKKQTIVVTKNIGLIESESIEDYIALGGYFSSYETVVNLKQEEVISLILASGIEF